MSTLKTCIFLFVCCLLTSPSQAVTHKWPGAAPCNASLQACINGSADEDRIEIATNAAITSSVSLVNRRLTLTAADGFKPVFQNANVSVSGTPTVDIMLRLSKIRFEGGSVNASRAGTGLANFDFRELTFDLETTGSGISVDANGGTVEAMLYDNRITGDSPFHRGLIDLRASNGSTLNVSAYYNHLARASGADLGGGGIVVEYQGSGTTGQAKLHANVIRGSFGAGGIRLSEGNENPVGASYQARVYNNVIMGGGAASANGIKAVALNGTIDAQLINNTITGVNDAVVYIQWASAATPEITGMIVNNILRGAHYGVYMNPSVAPAVTNNNNLINGPTSGFTADPTTITAPAKLISKTNARLSEDSPAIDAADTTTLSVGLLVNILPVTDADGLRRLKKKTPNTGGPTKADIGAYEYGDHSFEHWARPTNITNHYTQLNHPTINDQPDANIFASPAYRLSSTTSATGWPVGAWYYGSKWHLFNEDTTIPMPNSALFNVFAPGRGSGVIRHVATAENSSGATTTLDATGLKNAPDQIVFAMQNYNAGSVYNPNQIGVFYFAGGGTGGWHISNMDTSKLMPAGAGFSVYYQQASPNVFRVTATQGTRPDNNMLILDHPLLNDNACAQPITTRVLSVADNSNFDVFYDDQSGRWSIYDYDSMALGSQFHVLVNAAQAETCDGQIFSDGFE